MSTHRRRRLDRGTAEELLRGRPAGPLAGGEALAGLLAAAAGPARDSELAGEEQAVTAFRVAAHHIPATQPRRSSMISKLLTLKLALAAVLATAGGGVALAAATGNLPNGGSTPAAQSSASAAASARSTDHPAASPSPSLHGLCVAYTHGVATSKGKALDNPAFTALINAAGGKDNVAAFCKTELASKNKASAASHAPAQPAASHATGQPTDHPTGAPASHPTGRPTSVPAP